MKSNRLNLQSLVLAAIFAALMAVCSWISIPLPFSPVPLTLGNLAVLLAAGLLGPKYGSISVLVYLLLGAVGLPVFHNFTSGLGILTGPTGGYLVGYLLTAVVTGSIIAKEYKKTWAIIVALLMGVLSHYLLGTIWFMHITGTDFFGALALCVLPFLIGDGLKVLLATFLIKSLKPHAIKVMGH